MQDNECKPFMMDESIVFFT